MFVQQIFIRKPSFINGMYSMPDTIPGRRNTFETKREIAPLIQNLHSSGGKINKIIRNNINIIKEKKIVM